MLADFWRQHENAFGKVEDFFFNPTNIPALLGEYLQSKPQHILESLKRIVPENMHDAMGFDDWSWVKYLLDPDIGVLTMAELEVTEDVKALDEVYNERTAQHRYADHILRAINTIMGRELIDYLANHNVLPKYGFPVDVVELQLPHVDDGDVPELELQRELRIAISEYAPGSQVVAGGRLWTSRYLKRIPQKAWPKYRYAICECGNYKSVLADTGIELGECDRCNKPLEKAKEKGFFVIPEFGFIADNAVEKPSTSKPERTYSLYPNFAGKADEGRSIHMEANSMTITATAASHGKIAVLNTAGDAKFMICNTCGYAKVNSRMANDTVHKNPQGIDCHGSFQRLALGYEFETDILQMDFGIYGNNKDGFWLSLLYAILEGAAEALNIERQDIDGCLYPVSGSMYRPALILFDDVPGGAGHVNRIADETALKDVLNAALKRVSQCECGGEKGDASCYGCLRNYRNQRWHDVLNRGMVMEFLKMLL
ncbi:DUF1998 domain-containing protein [Mahella australiensis]|uniref:DUF1998 domain-containing protein n=1 Tax=Mahella australiensis TaxID=252966 RepID=UPI0011D18932|nr:DUF1998 domain-containing protein [Mahella australiensis]